MDNHRLRSTKPDGIGMDRESLVRFGEVWARKDLEACMEYFADDAVFHAAAGPGPGTAYAGKAAIRNQIEAIFANPAIAPLIPGDCFVLGDQGMAHWTLAITDDAGVARHACTFGK